MVAHRRLHVIQLTGSLQLVAYGKLIERQAETSQSIQNSTKQRAAKNTNTRHKGVSEMTLLSPVQVQSGSENRKCQLGRPRQTALI